MVIKKDVHHTFPILAVGGKAALEDREISSDEGINLAKSRDLDGFIECSAKTGENVDVTFEALTKIMLNNSKLL